MTDLERQIQEAGEATQIVRLNPDAALQRAILADALIVTGNEYDVEGHRCQRGEDATTGEVWYYYCPVGNWGNIDRFQRGVEPTPPEPDAYVVDGTNGDNANPGTTERPWRTIGKACRTLEAGDTVLIRGGDYNERLEPVNSGTQDKPITYAAHVVGDVRVRGTTDADAKEIVYCEASWVVFEGLTFQHQVDPPYQQSGWYHLVKLRGDHCKMDSCTVYRDGSTRDYINQGRRERGIHFLGTGHQIVNCRIENMNIGIDTRGSHWVLYRNEILGSGQDAIYVHNTGKGQFGIIEENLLDGSWKSDGVQFGVNSSLPKEQRQVTTDNRYTVVRGNTIRNMTENALDLKACQHVVVEQNVITGGLGSSDGEWHDGGHNRGGGMAITRGTNCRAQDIIIRDNIFYDNRSCVKACEGYRIYNNTMVWNNRDFTGPDTDHAYENTNVVRYAGIRQAEQDVAFKNNIVCHHNHVEVAVEKGNRGDLDYNVYWNPDAEERFGVTSGRRDWYPGMTFSEWQAYLRGRSDVQGNEEHSTWADPRFRNVPDLEPLKDDPDLDFGLMPDSPALFRAGPLTRTVGAGSGTEVTVEDSGYFSDGYGVMPGDIVWIGDNDVTWIVSISGDVLTLNQEITWEDADGVYMFANAGAA